MPGACVALRPGHRRQGRCVTGSEDRDRNGSRWPRSGPRPVSSPAAPPLPPSSAPKPPLPPSPPVPMRVPLPTPPVPPLPPKNAPVPPTPPFPPIPVPRGPVTGRSRSGASKNREWEIGWTPIPSAVPPVPPLPPKPKSPVLPPSPANRRNRKVGAGAAATAATAVASDLPALPPAPPPPPVPRRCVHGELTGRSVAADTSEAAIADHAAGAAVSAFAAVARVRYSVGSVFGWRPESWVVVLAGTATPRRVAYSKCRSTWTHLRTVVVGFWSCPLGSWHRRLLPPAPPPSEEAAAAAAIATLAAEAGIDWQTVFPSPPTPPGTAGRPPGRCSRLGRLAPPVAVPARSEVLGHGLCSLCERRSGSGPAKNAGIFVV